jgi:hypothetical protein
MVGDRSATVFKGLMLGLALLVVMPVAAQSEASWRVSNVQSLQELIGGDYTYHNAILSPDGSMIAWDDVGGVCIYTLADDETDCTPWDGEAEGVRTGRYNLPAWSPDSRQIAYTENFFVFFDESDIWTFDVEARTFTNRTDDGYYGGILRNSEFANVAIDYLPTWNPATGELYFFRSERRADAPEDEPGWSLALYRLGENDEAELVRDLTQDVPVLSIFRGVAFSPDGTQLAIPVLPADAVENEASGIWLLDLASGAFEQLVTLDELNAVMPEWQQSLSFPFSVHWAHDGLAVLMTNTDYTSYTDDVVYVKLGSGAVKPVIDFRRFESPVDLINARTEGPAPESDRPLVGVASPDGMAYWYLGLTIGPGEGTIYQADLPPNGLPEAMESVAFEPQPGSDLLATVSRDGKALLFNYLVTFEQE